MRYYTNLELESMSAIDLLDYALELCDKISKDINTWCATADANYMRRLAKSEGWDI